MSPFIQVDSAICQECGFFSTSRYQQRTFLDSTSTIAVRPTTKSTFKADYIKNYGENVGNQNEALIRVKSLDSYFKDLEGTSEFDIKNVKSAMDWGGADGRFLPSLSKNCEKYVYEVSSIEPLQGITRKQVLTDFDNYDYIQIAHVMEHVSNPFEFLKDPLKHLAKDGYLYVEVPLEIERPESIIV